MKFERSSGILMHPTSLPGKYGIGDLGPDALSFIDKLKMSGCKLWQVLPLGPTGYGDSPYQSFSAFAGNPLLISPELLLEEGLIEVEDLQLTYQAQETHVNFGELIPWKSKLLEKAHYKFINSKFPIYKEYEHFCEKNASWLDEFSAFMTIKELQHGQAWINWPDSLKQDPLEAIRRISIEKKNIFERHKFTQFLFFRQWNSIKTYANELGIKIIGDMPLYMAHDSADTWAHKELFQLDDNGYPLAVAGVPPDYFSSTGQLWGNPIFDWDTHKLTGYKWWTERTNHQLNFVDIIRLDHFRGFVEYWEIPGGDLTAEHGYWVKGPGKDLFDRIIQANPRESEFQFIAEDLGEITPDVIKLRDELSLPGMKILQFAFSDPDNVFLPHNFSHLCVSYTGTHDNDTTQGWFDNAPENEKTFAKEYLKTDGVDIAWDLIRACWSSVAKFAIAPMQDILNLGTTARMNFPGRLGENWKWRMQRSDFSKDIELKLHRFNEIYGRV